MGYGAGKERKDRKVKKTPNHQPALLIHALLAKETEPFHSSALSSC